MTTKLVEITERVEASMCMTYGSQHPEGREEARISREDWDELQRVLRFYASHDHWMSLSEDGPRVVLVALGDPVGVDGWSMAEGADTRVLQ